jgi:hypothetical protein
MLLYLKKEAQTLITTLFANTKSRKEKRHYKGKILPLYPANFTTFVLGLSYSTEVEEGILSVMQ